MPQKFKIFNETYVLLFGFRMPFHDVFYKKKNKNICHFIASMHKYDMTYILTNNNCLQLGISQKFNQLWKALLTQSRCHINLHLQSHVGI